MEETNRSQEGQRGMSTVLTVLIVILVAAGLGAGAYFGYNWWQDQAKKDTGQTGEQTPTPPPDPTAGWQTYTDSTNGFSLKFPPDWTTKEGTFPSTHGTTLKDVSFSGDKKVFVTVRTNPDATLEAFVNADGVADVKPAKVDTLDGFAAVASGAYRVYLGKDDKIYMFTFPGAATNTDLSDDQVNLLTSFQFTSGTSSTPGSSTSDTSSWQTYTNTKHDYSFKYSAEKYELIEDYGFADTGQGTDVSLYPKSGSSDALFIRQRESDLTAKAYADQVVQQSGELGGESSNRKTGSLVGVATEEFDLSGVYADNAGGESLLKPVHVIVFKKDTDLWIIRYDSSDADIPAVLSTFKLTS